MEYLCADNPNKWYSSNDANASICDMWSHVLKQRLTTLETTLAACDYDDGANALADWSLALRVCRFSLSPFSLIVKPVPVIALHLTRMGRIKGMTNLALIAKVETMAKEPRILAIAREYDDILEDIGNVELTAEMVAMVMIALERVSAMGQGNE